MLKLLTFICLIQLVLGTVYHINEQKDVLSASRPFVKERSYFRSNVSARRKRASDPQPFFTFWALDNTKLHNEAVLHWSDVTNSSVLFMLTKQKSQLGVLSSTLFRSSDYGDKYSAVPFPRGTIISYFIVSKLDPKIMLFADVKTRQVFRTVDEGATAIVLCGGPLPFTPDRLIFSPYDTRHVLLYSYANRTVYISPDLCQSWDLVAEHANSRIFWGVPGQDPPGIVHIEVEDLNTDGYRYRRLGPPYGAEQAEDSTELIEMNSLYVYNQYIFIQKPTLFSSNLYVSYNRTEFKRAFFPLDQNPLDFQLISCDDSQVMLVANHRQRHVSLYLSDATGQFYTLSLGDVVALSYGSSFVPDVYQVEGVGGVLLANQHTEDQPHTLITYNRGGSWRHLPPPEQDEDCKSAATCNLHLHLASSRWSLGMETPLSKANAPGLIIAHGTVGSQLESSSFLYISRDAGLTWHRAHAQSVGGDNFRVNVLDQGGALLAVNVSAEGRNTDTLMFSSDEGQTWTSYKFSDNKLQVDGVLNEPGITTLVASIFGHDGDSGWVVVRANFTSLLPRQCGENDYEQWSPADPAESGCLLGQTLTYERQKQGNDCRNGVDYTHSLSATICKCTAEDYKCDYGYVPSGTDCKPAPWFNTSHPVGDCPEGGNYTKSKGYRKVAADQCQGGDVATRYAGTLTPCPVMAPQELALSLAARTGDMLTNAVATNTNVTYLLQQGLGSKQSTNYTWDFQDGAREIQTGLDNNRHMSHVFTSPGVKVVKVKAENKAGSATAELRLVLEEPIRGVELEVPHGVQQGVPTTLEARLVTNGDVIEDPASASTVHFVWDFGDAAPGSLSKPLLSWEPMVEHTYSSPGNFTVSVQAVNALGARSVVFPVVVYGTLVTVRLSFSLESSIVLANSVFDATLVATAVQWTVANLLDLPLNTLEVVALQKNGLWAADVSLLPDAQLTRDDPRLLERATRLVDKVKSKSGLQIDIDDNNYGEDEVLIATHAEIVGEEETGHKHPPHLVALYVVIAVLAVAAMCALVFVYYRRRARTLRQRYHILHSSSQRPGDSTALLDDSDENDDVVRQPRDDSTLEDDDDVMLDPGRPGDAPPSQSRLCIQTGPVNA